MKVNTAESIWKEIDDVLPDDWSMWQKNFIARLAVIIFASIAAVFFSYHSCELIILVLSKGYQIVIFDKIVFIVAWMVIGLLFIWIDWNLYLVGNGLKELPIAYSENIYDYQWQVLFDEKDNFCEKNIRYYEQEFFYNSLVTPARVFARITEYVYPGSTIIDTKAIYEIMPPSKRGMHIVGRNDYIAEKGKTKPCFLIVPVGFQKRNTVADRSRIFTSSGTELPIVKSSVLNEWIIDTIESYNFNSNTIVNSNNWSSKRKRLQAYLDNTEENKDTMIVHEICYEMLKMASTESEKRFCCAVMKALVGLKEVIPICVNLHLVAVDDSKPLRARGRFPSRVIKVSVNQRRETEHKPGKALPNSFSFIASVVNYLYNRVGCRGDTMYFNLARAGRTSSYHLYLQGPENTYYSKGSLLLGDDHGHIPIARYVEMQRRYGQQNAHIYIRDGHGMSNVMFMFRYKKKPKDSYHIAFVATLVALCVLLIAAAISIIGVLDDFRGNMLSALSVPALILAVTTAMGPWVYNQSDRKRLVQASAIFLTLCSICGMFIYIFFISQKENFTDSSCLSVIAMRSWEILLTVAFLNMLLMLLISSRHTFFYNHLTMKPQKTKTSQMKNRPWKPRRIEYSSPDIRIDVPRGRYLQNEYARFVRSIWQMEEHYGIRNRNEYDGTTFGLHSI